MVETELVAPIDDILSWIGIVRIDADKVQCEVIRHEIVIGLQHLRTERDSPEQKKTSRDRIAFNRARVTLIKDFPYSHKVVGVK